MSKRILVVNPNSSAAVTSGIQGSLSSLDAAFDFTFSFRTLREGPPGIESDEHIEQVKAPLLSLLEQETADAFVIACFSDPGLAEARSRLSNPIFGIGESSFFRAIGQGGRFGILAILPASAERHQKRIQAMGLQSRFAASYPIGLSVQELLDEEKTSRRMIEIGQRLREEAKADVVILGCAGMAKYCTLLEEELKLPVVEPCKAAASAALSALS